MDADIVALVNSGATTLLGLMVTDAWGRTKKAAAGLFSHGDGDVASAVESDLDDSRERLQVAFTTGDREVEAELVTEWRSRLRRAVKDDDHAVDMLRDFVNRNSDLVEDYVARGANISISAQAHDNSRIYQQGQGIQHNY